MAPKLPPKSKRVVQGDAAASAGQPRQLLGTALPHAISGTAKHELDDDSMDMDCMHASTNAIDAAATTGSERLPISARWATTTVGDNSAIAAPTVTRLPSASSASRSRSRRKPSPTATPTDLEPPTQQQQPTWSGATASASQTGGDYNTLWAPSTYRTRASADRDHASGAANAASAATGATPRGATRGASSGTRAVVDDDDVDGVAVCSSTTLSPLSNTHPGTAAASTAMARDGSGSGSRSGPKHFPIPPNALARAPIHIHSPASASALMPGHSTASAPVRPHPSPSPRPSGKPSGSASPNSMTLNSSFVRPGIPGMGGMPGMATAAAATAGDQNDAWSSQQAPLGASAASSSSSSSSSSPRALVPPPQAASVVPAPVPLPSNSFLQPQSQSADGKPCSSSPNARHIVTGTGTNNRTTNKSTTTPPPPPPPHDHNPLNSPPTPPGPTTKRSAVTHPTIHHTQGPSSPTAGAARFDKRGYPIKHNSAISSTPSSPTHISPRSSQKVASSYYRTSTSPSSPVSDDYSRYRTPAAAAATAAVATAAAAAEHLGGDPQQRFFTYSPTTTAASGGATPPPRSTTAKPRAHRQETITGNTGAAGPYPVINHPAYDEKQHYADLESTDSSHYSSGIALPSWYLGGGEPKPEESICSSESWGDHKPVADSSVYQDFGINVYNNRRKFVSMLQDPHAWAHLGPEDDDDMHNPDVKTKQTGVFGSLLTVRGFANVGCLSVLVVGLVVLFAGYPIITATTSKPFSNAGGYNMGGINASGQLPDVGPFRLIDKDTPQSAYTHKSWETGEEWELVFSDEFNRDGRTFYPGDDPYWEAEDYHYWSTQNLEWYDPRQITTRDGHLVIQFTNRKTRGMNYTGGLMSTWNRFCFTGGYLEVAVSLPATNQVRGLWPAIWTLGNLGRVGYGGTLDGVWPYTYDSCDVGTVKNQSINGVPHFTKADGDKWTNYDFCYLPGQRFSRCTCQESADMHPGPKHPDGTFVGRGAPEIDIFEASVADDDAEGESTGIRTGRVSQSSQWAPFNPGYHFINTSDTYTMFVDEKHGWLNAYQGGVYQQATSSVIITENCYTNSTGCDAVYGFEYKGGDDGYITWVNNGTKSWRIYGSAMGPNSKAQIQGRPVPLEPMYIVMNLGMSPSFGAIDYELLDELYPVEMAIDYVRVYQDPKQHNIGCSPPDMPTAEYIERFKVAYTNPNITTFEQVMETIDGTSWPKNSLIDGCK